MGWLEDTPSDAQTTAPEESKFLKIPDAPVGKTTEVRLRILNEEPIGVWRHWLGSRAYNCSGMDTCPVCKVRNAAKKSDPEGYKSDYRLDYRYYFNVFVDGDVKIWSFTSSVGRKLKVFVEKYGDLRDYDISVSKRKTGSLPQNVEYDVIFEEKSGLTTKQSEATKYDLTPFIQPAGHTDLELVARGVSPSPAAVDASEEVKARSNKASKADMIMLTSLIKAKGFELSHFGIVDGSALPKEVVDKLIEELKIEKQSLL